MIVLENDEGLGQAFALLRQLRQAGISADMIATGSPKKRYDKAVKQNPAAILRVNEKGYYGFSGADTDSRLVNFLKSFAA
jgi:histidyl-tRNA synthetase